MIYHTLSSNRKACYKTQYKHLAQTRMQTHHRMGDQTAEHTDTHPHLHQDVSGRPVNDSLRPPRTVRRHLFWHSMIGRDSTPRFTSRTRTPVKLRCESAARSHFPRGERTIAIPAGTRVTDHYRRRICSPCTVRVADIPLTSRGSAYSPIPDNLHLRQFVAASVRPRRLGSANPGRIPALRGSGVSG